MRDKRWLYSFLFTGALLLSLPTVASARLLVSSPEGTLQAADVIITGSVTAREYGEAERRVTIEVDEVLQGDLQGDELSLAMQKNRVYGWVGFDFPDPGTEIFLLLRGQAGQGYWLARDLNCVAVVEGGRVTSLYQGSNVGIDGDRWSREDYAAAYDAFYQANRTPQEETPEISQQPGVAAGAGTGWPGGQQPAKGGLLSRVWGYWRGFWERLLDR
ncbi:MAG: hypothetical protein D9V47_01910 [Clostridia bacterium]|nr:MAG: hypothetical protein D9V47_01910 [Clostridia bacterium]